MNGRKIIENELKFDFNFIPIWIRILVQSSTGLCCLCLLGDEEECSRGWFFYVKNFSFPSFNNNSISNLPIWNNLYFQDWNEKKFWIPLRQSVRKWLPPAGVNTYYWNNELCCIRYKWNNIWPLNSNRISNHVHTIQYRKNMGICKISALFGVQLYTRLSIEVHLWSVKRII